MSACAAESDFPIRAHRSGRTGIEDIFFEVHERHGRLVAERVFENLLLEATELQRLADVLEAAQDDAERRYFRSPSSCC